MVKQKKYLILLMSFLLAGCGGAVPSYHGVSESTWQSLTAKQKQAIVDKDFADSMQE